MNQEFKHAQTLKPFHSRIFRLYIGYLQDKCDWPDEKIEAFLESLGTSSVRVYDDSTWFDLSFADKFYYRLVEETGDKDLAYHAGLYIKKSAFSATIYYLMRGLVSIGKIYELVSKFTPHFTKAARMEILDLTHEAAIIQSTPSSDIPERPYMCENRRGILQGLPQVFDLPLAQIREIECTHKGGKRCVYHVKWKERSNLRYATISSLLGLTVFGLVNFYFSFVYALISGFFVLGISVLLLTVRRLISQGRELALHNSVLDSAVQDIEKKNRQLELISQISKLTHALTSPEEMSKVVVKSVVDLLEYDRAIFLKVIPELQVLKVVSHFGFEESLQETLKDMEFVIRPDNLSGFFIKVVNTKRPVLIEDVNQEIHKLSSRSQKFAQMLKARSFVAVPIMDRNSEVTGVLAVDYVDGDRKMSISDQDLLMMLADHISIAYYNSHLLSALEDSLKKTKINYEIQENLRSLFQKFIPSDLVSELSRSTDLDYRERVLKTVRKKWVSVLFADIKDFSVLATEFPAEHVVDILNICFGEVTPLISQYRGFIDKFTGDGFMAVFESSESPLDACRAALHIVQVLDVVREKLMAKSYHGIQMGFGIHYGPAILGNVGSDDRLNFTVIGDTVNLASRLESYTRRVGSNTICVSEQVRSFVGDRMSWKDLGQVKLKGFSGKLQVFQLLHPGTSEPSIEGNFRSGFQNILM